MEIAHLSIPTKTNQLLNIKGVSTAESRYLNQVIDSLGVEPIRLFDADSEVAINNIDAFQEKEDVNCLINLRLGNRIKSLVSFFCAVNNKLPIGGVFICCVETSKQRKKRLYKKFPKGLRTAYYSIDYFGKRVIPKVPFFKRAYFFLTADRNQALTEVEFLGRLVYCGFKIESTKEVKNKLYVVLKKEKTVFNLKERSYGLLFRMQRTGYKGNPITVYKIRSMYAYSEYLQEYIYESNKLAEGGKFKDDYRVNMLGNFFRKLWLDELPMIYNLLKGDLKLVGVRPLSKHYLSLYTNELIELREQFKPGLIPPYYADLPNSFDEIMESEKNYFESYQKEPYKTDFRYFFKAIGNIILKKARSK